MKISIAVFTVIGSLVCVNSWAQSSTSLPLSTSFPAALPDTIVPQMDLDFWNKDWMLQFDNNCYNYATNRVTNSFAQPGEASGAKYSELSCADVYTAASQDLGLTPTEYFPYQEKTDDSLIALVVSPGYDFHWYRRDDNGAWSHKMGGTPAGAVDNSGQEITDPETADRGDYTDFCGYFRLKNFPWNADEQDGGYVRIGDMTDLPSLKEPKLTKNIRVTSTAEFLKYSGRVNPKVSLKELLATSAKPALESIARQFKSQRPMVAALRPAPPAPKLGFNGVMIQDVEGLLFAAGTRIHIVGNEAYIYTPGRDWPRQIHITQDINWLKLSPDSR